MTDIPSHAIGSSNKTVQKAWMRHFGKKILRAEAFQNVASALLERWLRFTWNTNRDLVAYSSQASELQGEWPVILAIWHGQQFLAPYTAPPGSEVVTLVSRSADAEINARVIERAGLGVIRGSGGRGQSSAGKGGARALIGMRDALKDGTSVAMIADISKGTPRQAGAGIVLLAKISGRPIVPLAVATSRYKVLEKTWDKTTINLPFGRRCVRAGKPIYVPADASEEMLEAARAEVTAALNQATAEAYAAVERKG